MAAPAVVPITKAKQEVFDNHQKAAQKAAQEADYKRSIDTRAAHIDSLEAEVDALTKQARMLAERKQKLLVEIETSENALLAEMRQLKASKLIGMERVLTMKPNPPRLVVLDESKIPADYLREKTVVEPDKLALKAALAAGEEIAGVKLEQGVSLIRK